MKKTTRRPLAFAAMPKDYDSLCRMFMPRPIHDQTDYDNTAEVADAFAGFEQSMTRDQVDYFDLLCTIIENHERAHAKWPHVSGLQVLQHLCEENDISGAELSRILGTRSRMLGAMILRGERAITAEHARALGKRFHLPPGIFIE